MQFLVTAEPVVVVATLVEGVVEEEAIRVVGAAAVAEEVTPAGAVVLEVEQAAFIPRTLAPGISAAIPQIQRVPRMGISAHPKWD